MDLQCQLDFSVVLDHFWQLSEYLLHPAPRSSQAFWLRSDLALVANGADIQRAPLPLPVALLLLVARIWLMPSTPLQLASTSFQRRSATFDRRQVASDRQPSAALDFGAVRGDRLVDRTAFGGCVVSDFFGFWLAPKAEISP